MHVSALIEQELREFYTKIAQRFHKSEVTTSSDPYVMSVESAAVQYAFRQTRAPLNRHLNAIVIDEVRMVSNSHYLQQLTRTLSNATVKDDHTNKRLRELQTNAISSADDHSGAANDFVAFRSRQRSSSLSKAVALDTFESDMSNVDGKDMCLCGLLSLQLSVHLICCIEVFFAMVLLIQAPDLLTMNGQYFYFLGLFDGGGETLFTLHIFLLLILGFGGRMLLPSSVVLSAMMIVPVLCEVWWSYLTLCYYKQLTAKVSLTLRGKTESAACPADIISTQC
ncbi:unnamed protein product [Nippostrongylus brasiliensis]|uniref:SNF2_N domain-containing protein n=1 Tax=Nippostrongylus brasiliensis TaxID=27835 RepID=A0A158QWI7_NIPBR|nr:unnamed protein product [Nippostrongylus brasiliensis]